MFHEYYGIGSRECQSKTTDVRRKQQTVNAGIRIERLYDSMSFVGLCTAI